MKKITEQQLIERSNQLKAKIIEGDRVNAWSGFWDSPWKAMTDPNYRAGGADPNDTEDKKIEVPGSQWGLWGLSGSNYTGQTGAIKSEGTWYTLPGKNYVPRENVVATTALEKLAIQKYHPGRKYIDPTKFNATPGEQNAATYDVDTNKVVVAPGQQNGAAQRDDTKVTPPPAPVAVPTPTPAGPKEGQTGTYDGKKVIFKGGKWEYAQ